jgi:hypothetical protein
MTKLPVGTRVAAIRNTLDKTVFLYGYGVYDGNHPVEIMEGLVIDNPRITLDNGQIVWGAECWWGAEEMVKQKYAGYTFEIVPMEPLL